MNKFNTLLRKEVVILGANNTFGRLTSLLLKRSPEVNVLRLHDGDECSNSSDDLNLINTKCLVKFYTGNDTIQEAIKSADVIVIGDDTTKELNMQNSFLRKAQQIIDYAINIAIYNPGAVVVVASSPVNSTLPLVSNVLEDLGKLNPDKVLGMTNVDNMRASSLLAQHLRIGPGSAWVPVVGGSTQETRVPLYSKARPVVNHTLSMLQRLTCEVKTIDLQVYRAKGEHELTNRAYATAELVKAVLRGLGGKDKVRETVFSRHDLVPGAEYFSLPVLLGENGIRKRIPLPEISEYEDSLVKHSVRLLAADALKAKEYVRANLNPQELIDNQRLTKIIERNNPLQIEANPRSPDTLPTKRPKRRNIYEEHLALNEIIGSEDVAEQANHIRKKEPINDRPHQNISQNEPEAIEKPVNTEKVIIASNDNYTSQTVIEEDFVNNIKAKLLFNSLNPFNDPEESSETLQTTDKTTKSLVKVRETKIKSLMPINNENHNSDILLKNSLNSKVPFGILYSETDKNNREINKVNNNNSRTKKTIQCGRIPPPFTDRREYTNVSNIKRKPAKHTVTYVRERSVQIEKEPRNVSNETRISLDEKPELQGKKTANSDVMTFDTGVNNELKKNLAFNNNVKETEIISMDEKKELSKNEDKGSNVRDTISDIIIHRLEDSASNTETTELVGPNKVEVSPEIINNQPFTELERDTEHVPKVNSECVDEIVKLRNIIKYDDNLAFDCNNSFTNSVIWRYVNEATNVQKYGSNSANGQLLKRVNYVPTVEFSRSTSSETVSKGEEGETEAVVHRRKQKLRADQVWNFFKEKRKQYAKDEDYHQRQRNAGKKKSILNSNLKFVRNTNDESNSLTKKLKERQRKLIMSLQKGNFEDYGDVPKIPSKTQTKMLNRNKKIERQTDANGQVKDQHSSYIDRLNKGNKAERLADLKKCKRTESTPSSQSDEMNLSSNVAMKPPNPEEINDLNARLEASGTPENVGQSNTHRDLMNYINLSIKSKAGAMTGQPGKNVEIKVSSETSNSNVKEEQPECVCKNKTHSKEPAITENSPSQTANDTKPDSIVLISKSDIVLENKKETKIDSLDKYPSQLTQIPEEITQSITDGTTQDTQLKGPLNVSGYAVKFEPRNVRSIEEQSKKAYCNTKDLMLSDTKVKCSKKNANNIVELEDNKVIVSSARQIRKETHANNHKLTKNDNCPSNNTINSITNESQTAMSAVENKQYTDYLMKSNVKHLADLPDKDVGVIRLEMKNRPVKSKGISSPAIAMNKLSESQDITYSNGEVMKAPQRRNTETSSSFHDKLAKSAEKIASLSNLKKNQQASACLKSVKINRYVERLSIQKNK